VVAEFRSPRNRHRAFEALRDGGYNPTVAEPARAEQASSHMVAPQELRRLPESAV
jgi:hypothetical protein